ncbi:DNA translocase FtsK 4TM domain-containing protein [Catenibacillus scindens]|uniref:FtsK/SpoIIIE family DNA translocase n=1 Tax=Catenibacillus scindens TaxID=673271 RepID=UPI0032093FED
MAARQTETARSGNRRTPAKKTSPARTSGKNTTGKSKSPAKGRTSGKGKTSLAKGSSANKKNTAVDYRRRSGMYDELELIIALAVSILLLLSIYDLCGSAGRHISHFMFGVVGWIAYLVPYMIFFGTAFYISNRHNRVAAVKILSGIVLFVAVAAFAQMITDPGDTYLSVLDFYEDCAVYKNGGGIVGGLVCRLLTPFFGVAGSYLIIIAIFAVALVLFAGKSVFVTLFRKISHGLSSAAASYRRRQALLAQAREERRQEEEQARLERMADAASDQEEPEDYEDFDEDYEDEEDTKKASEGKIRIFRSRKKKNHEEMIQPEGDYGEKIAPISFDIKGDSHAGEPADTSLKKEADSKDFASEKELDFPDLTITRMEDITSAKESGGDLEKNFDFTPDPVYLEPDELVQGDGVKNDGKKSRKDSMIEIPDFMVKPTSALTDPFGTTLPLPDLSKAGLLSEETASGMDEAVDIDLPWEETKKNSKENAGNGDRGSDEIRQRTVEEKYTNLGEYVPGQADLSPTETVKMAASRSPKADNAPEPVTDDQIMPQVKEYVFPPMDLLKRGKPLSGAADSDKYLKDTARKLQETLDSFGVKVHVTNVSCGPSVTRYELSPEQGVKVSRILSLTDDIKLNLAVADIRIEAPIPGKAAVGIEVPNKETSTVMLRDLLESQEFKTSKSLIAFAVGRDIGGQVIIADIAKMPHLLIAGATGSGKSVCINTLIMSIIYKAKPEDVRMIMIDPKVVELSVYNGIPHLLIPVVTDPKKAAGALNWAVAEMEKRYAKFAQLNVRDMKSYNAKIEATGESEDHKRLPQIVIIVDELADLMMVASNEVEDAICRLAQLARAAGIHLVIATQRPSVNVITGLIKANIPSRIAFSVSSGVDSRTIIDMNGAEKLLGKGDMLFYPTGYQKPVRVQGSFVSDEEVNAVVDFLTKDQEQPQYSEAIVNSISSGAAVSAKGSAPERDIYFVEAGRMIIEKDKASIGMLQRVYRIGFNRAARIMDQLCEAGVVGPEEGTKPRKVLMSPEEFEKYVEEYV